MGDHPSILRLAKWKDENESERMSEAGGVQMLGEKSSCSYQTRRCLLHKPSPCSVLFHFKAVKNLMGRCQPSSSSSSPPPSLLVSDDQAAQSINVPLSLDTVAELRTNLSFIYVFPSVSKIEDLCSVPSIEAFLRYSAWLWIQSPYQSFERWQTNRSESATWITGLRQPEERTDPHDWARKRSTPTKDHKDSVVVSVGASTSHSDSSFTSLPSTDGRRRMKVSVFRVSVQVAHSEDTSATDPCSSLWCQI